MKRICPLAALLLLLVVSAGCNRPKVIPRGKFAQIAEEMLLTDQWLRIHQEVDRTTDTSLVYEPIFRRYGYTTEDFLYSETHYMREPQKYAKIMREAARNLDKEIASLNKVIERLEYLESFHLHAAPPVKKVLARFSQDSVFHGWPRVMVDEDLRIYLTDYSRDTVYRGPEMIIREPDSLSHAADTLALDSLSVPVVRKGKVLEEAVLEEDPEEIEFEPARGAVKKKK